MVERDAPVLINENEMCVVMVAPDERNIVVQKSLCSRITDHD